MYSLDNKTDATTLVAQACAKVNGFSELYKRLERKISISGRSLSTLKNYSCHMAHIAQHFNCLPTELDEEQIEDYLHLLFGRVLRTKDKSCPVTGI